MTVPPEQSLSRSLPYATAVQRSDPAPHSRMGVASFAIGVVVVVGNIVLVVLAAVFSQTSQKSALVAIGLLFFAGVGLSIVGIALGVIAVIQRDRRKLLAIVGLFLNGGTLLVFEGLLFIGLAMKK